jgi:four helix bundle protein
LRVYQLAVEVQLEIFETSKRFPVEDRYALTDQIRRASRSIGANLVEAWQKRRYVAHFVSKLTDADGEQAETQHWLDTATACNYVSEKEQSVLLGKCARIGQMLGTMMAKPEKFCHERPWSPGGDSPSHPTASGPQSSALSPLIHVRHLRPV